MKTQRNTTTLAVSAAMLIGAGLSASREPADILEAPGPGITLRMLNQADVDKRTLLKSEKEAAAILRRAGVELIWLACEAGRTDGRAANPCQRDRSAAEFWFTIVKHKPARTSSDMLGFTEFDETIGISAAGVYYPSAIEAAKKCHADVFQILGAAIAHEVGHLILGANAHSPGGVMSPNWGPAQFERISISDLSFSPDQAKLLQAEVRRRTAWAGHAAVKEITIRVFNSAKVSKGDLAGALKVASAIYAEAGIGITWEQGSDDDHESKALDFSANGVSDGACTGRRLGELNLGLDRAPANGVKNSTLGFALPCAKYGSGASVFVDRCERVMQGTTASFGKILGHAIAHEVGHVLLGTNGHSVGGLMRARWGRAEWQTVAAAHLAIAPADAEKMAASLLLYGQSAKTTTGAR